MLRPDAHVFSTAQHLELATQLVDTSFGPIVTKVASRLLSFGAATLSELARETQLPLPQLRSSLMVLIQQNIVRSSARPISSRS